MNLTVNNARLLHEVKKSLEAGVATEYLNHSIVIIAEGYSTFRAWGKPEHDEYRDEMTALAKDRMNINWRKFDVKNFINPFGYLATITCSAFIETAKKYDPDFTPPYE